MPPLIHIVRHGEALHNTHPAYPDRDPPLTKSGHYTTKHKHLPAHPDLILISPLTRTIQTALNMFPFLSSSPSASLTTTRVPAHIWPDLRETPSSSPCNQCSPRSNLAATFPQFDFSSCPEEGWYAGESEEEVVARAERVRRRVGEAMQKEGYENVFLVTHKGFKGYLVKGRRFGLAEVRSYRVAGEEE
ncbi:hypothetical protein COCVIDRAFT_50990, partial [Bipolaris victoriae FI3]